MEERWMCWEPASDLQKRYYIEALCDSMQGFRVILSDAKDRNKRVLINFEDSVEGYRYSEETMRCNLIYELSEKYGRDFCGDWSLFRVENSSYMQWAIAESLNIVENWGLQHFCIIGSMSVLDIINGLEPKVTIINPSDYIVGATFTFDNVK
jgi:hypothetical protein